MEDANIAVRLVPKATMVKDREGDRTVAVELIGEGELPGPIEPADPETDLTGVEIDPLDVRVALEYG